ncbi:disks large-associated protein 5 [Harpegnathos saltator]|uniref:Disks large-associated protein 5 n=1 Tax=Harpegnathos saltator TaxID=610380 RepID=E2B8N2_HARSA|nr:disks large-associated protein 5 [Harpegnathos saltator]EFN87938.1 Disks large-associated protein 5 [Harpegnathos saltator]
MSHLQQQYKNPRQGFGDTDHGRIIRAYKQEKSRKEVRTQDFAKNRKLQDVSVPPSPQRVENIPTITDERAKKLMKWKEERNRKRRLQDAKKKPVFKVGIVHHALYSPVTKCNTALTVTAKSSNQVKYQNDIQKRITRATEKRLLAKAAAMKVTSKKPLDIKRSISDTKIQKSFAPDSHKFRPPSGLSRLPLFGVVAIEQTPSEKGDFFENKDCKTHDANNQKLILEKLNSQNIIDLNIDTTDLKTFENSNLSSDKQELSESISNLNTTFEINKITELSNEQNVQEFLQGKSLSSDVGKETSVQKTPVTDTSSKKEDYSEDLILFSPYLTLSRGKKNARKEQMLRLGISPSPSDDIPTKDTVIKNLNISIQEEERTAQYFKLLLNKEINRLKELCTKWLEIQLEKDVPEDAKYEINQAIGQTNLLINKKFERFRGLVSDCETGKGQMLVTCKDLQGFWDMTYMEVRDCDSRFEKLEQRRNREWQEMQSTIDKPVTKKRMTIKKQIVSKPSSLRTLILAARRKKMEEASSMKDTLLQNTNINKDHLISPLNNKKSINFKENTNTRYSTRKSKSIDCNDFKLTPVKHDSCKASWIKLEKVQFSDTIKKIRSPLAIMKISQMCKTPEIQLDDTISYINSDQTPSRSILKKSEEMIDKETRMKSAHKVIFDDQINLTEVPNHEETQTSKSLAAALNRIDSLDLDDSSPERCINAEKRLNFETEDSSDNAEFSPSEVQKQLKEYKDAFGSSVLNAFDSNVDLLSDITSVISSKEISPKVDVNTKSPRKSVRRRQELDLEIRTLRNRIIITNDTPKVKRRSKMLTPKKASVGKKKNERTEESNRRKSLKLLQTDKDDYIQSDENNAEINDLCVHKKKRLTRKSVAFDAESCLVSTENKPVLPMTPHSKRMTPSRKSRSKHEFDENVILQETPKPLGRVTRSYMKN